MEARCVRLGVFVVCSFIYVFYLVLFYVLLGSYVTLKRAGIDVTANSFVAQQRLACDAAPYAD